MNRTVPLLNFFSLNFREKGHGGIESFIMIERVHGGSIFVDLGFQMFSSMRL